MQRSVVAVGVAVACAAAPGAAVAADVIDSGTTGRHGAVSVVERGGTLRLSISDRPTCTRGGSGIQPPQETDPIRPGPDGAFSVRDAGRSQGGPEGTYVFTIRGRKEGRVIRGTFTSAYRFGRIRCASRGVSFGAGRSDLSPGEVGSLRR